MGIAAVNTANNLIYVITSTLLGFMLLSGIAGKSNLEAVDVSVSLPEEIYAKTPAPVIVRVRNRRRFFPIYLVYVHVGSEKVLFTYVERASEKRRTIPVRFERRGAFPSVPVWVASPFPFGFFERTRLLSPLPTVIVYPKPVPCRPATKPFAQTDHGEDKSLEHRTGEEHDLRSIREYQAGDPLKKIHWKCSARTDRWLTKEFSITTEDAMVVNVAHLPGKNWESRLSCAAFVINWAVRRGKAVGLVLEGQIYEPKASLPHKRELLKALALHGQD
ncbi:DUF58 domain-containing protein [Desulfosoma caldarium]|uniref:Uncharacterized protein DUF58 n=1 Tax=Desulfosoma caldarium TaxID=610254 RepID=A0A3N1UXF6_9BACT|nr:DUF58 domain-containing protein [Desulfosoma caldarium]ROQ93360.1 uncharacterized protein DUF58 [Desulfosoma caldarium]